MKSQRNHSKIYRSTLTVLIFYSMYFILHYCKLYSFAILQNFNIFVISDKIPSFVPSARYLCWFQYYAVLPPVLIYMQQSIFHQTSSYIKGRDPPPFVAFPLLSHDESVADELGKISSGLCLGSWLAGGPLTRIPVVTLANDDSHWRDSRHFYKTHTWRSSPLRKPSLRMFLTGRATHKRLKSPLFLSLSLSSSREKITFV